MSTTIDKTLRTPTEYPHIERDYLGRPVIKGTRMRVSMIVDAMFGANQSSPADLVENFPELLDLTKVHEALAYYHAHRGEIQNEMDERDRNLAEFMNRPEQIESRERHRQQIVQFVIDHPDQLLDNDFAQEIRRSLP